MAAQMQNFLQEAAEYILEARDDIKVVLDLQGTTPVSIPSQNLIEGAEMIKAFNG